MTESNRRTLRTNIQPVIGGTLLMILGYVVLFLYLYPRLSVFLEKNQIVVPQANILPALIYFFAVVIIMGVVLFLVPISILKLIMRLIFCLIYGWGAFIILGLILPGWVALGLAICVGIIWFVFPLVWLQNILLLTTLVAIGAVFGTLLTPWKVIWILLAISVYDIVAVFAGYMLWMAKKMSESDALPAFVLPRRMRDWNLKLKGSAVNKIFNEENAERDYALLGGGDIGFPLVFVASVYALHGMTDAIVVAAASLVGLLLAYFLQMQLLKGKPLPALPPISLVAFLGFVLVRYII